MALTFKTDGNKVGRSDVFSLMLGDIVVDFGKNRRKVQVPH